MNWTSEELKTFLDAKVTLYNQPSFVETDPIQVPHGFTKHEDIEIAAFLTASIAWGNRKMIIRSAQRLMQLMQNRPYDFIMHADSDDFLAVSAFVHRTFNGIDAVFFLQSLRNIYQTHGGLKNVFENAFAQTGNIKDSLVKFREIFFEISHPQRTEKHVSDVARNSAAKRLNMLLMWLVRDDNKGVHFGLWNKIPTSALYIPLDVHVSRYARELGLLTRKQDDWLAVEELTKKLRIFSPDDPTRYDFALFGMGVFEKL